MIKYTAPPVWKAVFQYFRQLIVKPFPTQLNTKLIERMLNQTGNSNSNINSGIE